MSQLHSTSGTFDSATSNWKAELRPRWDVLGPFPIHAREQHFLSPCFPLDLSTPYNHESDRTWFSSLADNGIVSWSSVQSDNSGNITVSFPNVRWSHLRSTEGWAVLQYQVVLHSVLTITPPLDAADCVYRPRLRVNLSQGSFFSVVSQELPVGTPLPVPEWHIGNIYALHGTCANSVELPSPPKFHGPNFYDIFVCGNYEIRLFGDPRASGIEQPTLQVCIDIGTELCMKEVVRDDSIDVVCDFIEGYALGDCLGVGFRSVGGQWTAKKIVSSGEMPSGFSLALTENVSLAPSQRRVISISISQRGPVYTDSLKFAVQFSGEADAGESAVFASIPVTVKCNHYSHWALDREADASPLRATCRYTSSQPMPFLVIPPRHPSGDEPNIPILALHGAGVDVFVDDFWVNSLKRQPRHWIIAAVGRSEWGLDWHGPSAKECWIAVSALAKIIRSRDHWRVWAIDPSRVVLIGHSNGGQGVWYLASHYPDKVHAAIPAAAYLKAQTYVPMTYARSGHFIDPSLQGVLHAASISDDNDLFMSNVVGIPILAIHGGDDGNVPTWHSREYVSTALEWAGKSTLSKRIKYHEDPHKPHWYSSVFSSDEVTQFLDTVLADETTRPAPSAFTFRVADPGQSGSMFGWSISQLRIPGRLGEIRVLRVSKDHEDELHVRTRNVSAIGLTLQQWTGIKRLYIDNVARFAIIPGEERVHLTQVSLGNWQRQTPSHIPARSIGKVQNILTSLETITIVIPSDSRASSEKSLALRLAHSLDTYLRLDCDIFTDEEFVKLRNEGALRTQSGNVIVIGGHNNDYTRELLTREVTEFSLYDECLAFRGSTVHSSELGAMFIHPHPICHESMVLLMIGNSPSAYERLFHLFPIRTGISVPDWVIIGCDADRIGAAGLIGAGIWSNDWKWNESVSWY